MFNFFLMPLPGAAFMLFTLLTFHSPEYASQQEPAPKISHLGLDSLLRKYVRTNGMVDYKGLKARKTALDAYCKYLGEHMPDDSWTKWDQMAYWINAYNAFTLQLIVDHYPISSITKLDKGKAWDVKRIPLGRKKFSLNQIENEKLRAQFKDPRIHFAINCAAKSCPPLLNKAYVSDNLDATLDARTKSFINNKSFNILLNNKATVSKIFDWYAADFGDLKTFLNQYSVSQVGHTASIVFQEYNWDLNE